MNRRKRPNLQKTRVSSTYRHALEASYGALSSWAVVHHRDGPFLCLDDADAMNSLLIDYIQDLFDREQPISQARHAVLAVQFRHRHLWRQLKSSWDSVKSWEMQVPLKLRVPCPPLIADCLFGLALLKGFKTDKKRAHLWIPMGILTRLSWHGLLRPGEAVGLRGRDVVLPSALHASLHNCAILNIQNPKNRRSLGKCQVSRIDDSVSVKWLAWLVTDLDPDLKLFPSSLCTFRSLYRELCVDLEITHLGLTPASMRPGGATDLFIGGVETSRLRVLGRWRTLESLDHYVQIAASALAVIRVPAEVLIQLKRIVAQQALFASPPIRQWSRFFSRAQQLRAVVSWNLRHWQHRSGKQRPLFPLAAP